VIYSVQTKKRGFEAVMEKVTAVLGVIFFVLATRVGLFIITLTLNAKCCSCNRRGFFYSGWRL
jgi:preprotein translocase subunit SecG